MVMPLIGICRTENFLNSYKGEFGHIKVKRDDDKIGDRTIVYARVSSNDRKESLKGQQRKKIIVINKIFICSMKLSSFYIWFLVLMLGIIWMYGLRRKKKRNN